MRFHRSVRTIATLASVGMLAAAGLASPAHAGAKKISCSPFSPGMEAAADAPVTAITSSATKKKPVVIELEHPATLPLAPENQYFNIQIKNPSAKLNILHEFGSDSDIDLYLYDATGTEVASSGAFNPAPVPGVTDADGNGGTGFESISGLKAGQCQGFSIESAPYLTPGTTATLKIWLG